MAELKFVYDWMSAGNDSPEYRQTMAMLALHYGNINLMKNQDIWSRTIRESVLVSAYPLAMRLTLRGGDSFGNRSRHTVFTPLWTGEWRMNWVQPIMVLYGRNYIRIGL